MRPRPRPAGECYELGHLVVGLVRRELDELGHQVGELVHLEADALDRAVALIAVVADGGGDTPESVNAALHDAIHKPKWRGGQTVSLAFLVGDAAPHLDYPDDADDAVEVSEAASGGSRSSRSRRAGSTTRASTCSGSSRS